MEVCFSRVSTLAACHQFFFIILSVLCSYFMIFVLGKLTELKLSGVMRGDWVSVDSFV